MFLKQIFIYLYHSILEMTKALTWVLKFLLWEINLINFLPKITL